MSSWNYAGACASPKGTLIYLYSPNGGVKEVLGMDASSRGIWWDPEVPMWRNILHHSAERRYPPL